MYMYQSVDVVYTTCDSITETSLLIDTSILISYNGRNNYRYIQIWEIIIL